MSVINLRVTRQLSECMDGAAYYTTGTAGPHGDVLHQSDAVNLTWWRNIQRMTPFKLHTGVVNDMEAEPLTPGKPLKY